MGPRLDTAAPAAAAAPATTSAITTTSTTACANVVLVVGRTRQAVPGSEVRPVPAVSLLVAHQ